MCVKTETGRKLMHIYNILFERFGPQYWWPADSPFEVIVGAILTQFVSWNNVEIAVSRLKEENLLSVEGICKSDYSKLEELVKSTRFYKQKAKRLRSFCCYVLERYNGDLHAFFNKTLYELRDELLTLYGIGEETADSIILYAAEMPIFVVDAYTRRVFSRLGFFDESVSYADMQMFFMENLEHDVSLFNEYHALIDAFGKLYCTSSRPACDECPLYGLCSK